MDKVLDFQIYDVLQCQTSQIPRKQVLHARIVKLYPNQSRTSYERIGLVLGRRGQIEKSLPPFRRAIIIDPHNPRAHIDLINNFLCLNREKEALSSMKRGLCLCHDNFQLHSLIVATFVKQERVEDLGSFYQETANMLTDKKLIPSLYKASAQALVDLNQYPQALISYQKAIDTSPVEGPHYLYHYSYALALYHEGFLEEALVQFEHAWRLNPSNDLTKHNIAYLNYCLGRFEKALEEFEYIVQNGLESYCTYSSLLLVVYHLDKGKEVINKYKDLLRPYIQSCGRLLVNMYKEALGQTEVRLQSEIDEKTREFETKKLEGINMILSFINQEGYLI